MKNKIIYFGICIFCLAAVLLIEQFTNLDVWISNQIYDFEQHRWPITPALHQRFSPVFYEGAKHFVAFVGTICVIYMLGSIKKRKWRRNFAAVLTVLLCTIIVPTVVGSLKKMTNVYCPNQLAIYEAFYPYAKVFEKYPDNFQPQHKGRCFPGGHVTGAFSLMSLVFVFRRRRQQYVALGGAIAFGMITGTYQMLRGEHFFLHNLTSFFIAAIFIVFIHVTVVKSIACLRKRQGLFPVQKTG